MPISVDIKAIGLKDSLRTLRNFSGRLDSKVHIKYGLLASGVALRDALNAEAPEYAGKCEVYQISPTDVRVGPSIGRVLEILEIPEGEVFEGSKRCLYLYYQRSIEPDKRIPVIEIDRTRIDNIIARTKPIITEYMVDAIKRGLRG